MANITIDDSMNKNITVSFEIVKYFNMVSGPYFEKSLQE